jgi:hypothetical protein
VSESPDVAAMSKAIASFWLNAVAETSLVERVETAHAGRSAR